MVGSSKERNSWPAIDTSHRHVACGRGEEAGVRRGNLLDHRIRAWQRQEAFTALSDRSDPAERRHSQPTHDQHRKDASFCLCKPVLSMIQDIEAVADGILSVETTHWHGALNKGPHFDLFPAGQPDFKSFIEKSETGTTHLRHPIPQRRRPPEAHVSPRPQRRLRLLACNQLSHANS
jgi:hypothetical protein